jgi:hypothetical protein
MAQDQHFAGGLGPRSRPESCLKYVAKLSLFVQFDPASEFSRPGRYNSDASVDGGFIVRRGLARHKSLNPLGKHLILAPRSSQQRAHRHFAIET